MTIDKVWCKECYTTLCKAFDEKYGKGNWSFANLGIGVSLNSEQCQYIFYPSVLMKAVEKHDRLIAIKQSIKKATIIGISFDEKIIISTPSWGISYLTFEQLFESYIFADGFPCGELAE